ncbi:DUF2523 family protein [Aggregatibacter aphrophilus]|uniref:DUF2523 family protein n=1 Tax=Aggregatibacter aphrophilus TaxID=732 RepID=UPI000D6521C4|nr:DUF2523 family protein [Aggregatibacter aphrophilus]
MIITVPVTVATFLKFVFVKAMIVLIIYIAITYGIDYLLSLLESLDYNLSTYSGSLGQGISYILNYLKFKDGVSLILSAYSVRFLIRRIPFIGG